MANSWVNLSSGDKARVILDAFLNRRKFLGTIDTSYDEYFGRDGRKNSGTLIIPEPNEYTVTTGAVMNAQDTVEASQTLTVATRRHVAMNVTSQELTLDIDNFTKQCINPAVDRLLAEIENIAITQFYKDVFNMTGTAASALNSQLAVLNAGARLTQGLADDEDRHIIIDPLNMATSVNALGLYFHKASELERAFSKGYIGEAGGFKWWESTLVPSHTAGTRTTTALCNTSTGITSGTATIAITGASAGTTFTAGDIINVGDAYAVNRQTKGRYSHLQQFTVTEAATVAGAGTATLTVSPKPITSGARQNVELVSAGASKTVTLTVNGAASSVIVQPLAYQRKAFTFVSAPLVVKSGLKMAQKNYKGVSLRIWEGDDIVNDKFPTRIDWLGGFKTVRPEWACRVQG